VRRTLALTALVFAACALPLGSAAADDSHFAISHGAPRTAITGDKGDPVTMYSPLDPIFYFHHTFVDLVWWQWQKKHPSVDQYEGVTYSQGAGGR